MNGKEKRKKNRNIFLRNQAHNVSPNNAENKRSTDEQPTTTTGNVSDVSLYLYHTNQANKSHRINYPSNLSTILPPSNIKTIPKLNLPSLTNNTSTNNSASNRTNSTSRVGVAKFKFPQKNNSIDLSFIKKNDIIIFGSPTIPNTKNLTRGCLSPTMINYSRNKNNNVNYNSKRTMKFNGFSDNSSSECKTERKKKNLTFVYEDAKIKTVNTNKKKNSSQKNIVKLINTLKTLQLFDKQITKKPSSTEKPKMKKKTKLKLTTNIIPKRNFKKFNFKKINTQKIVDKEAANPVAKPEPNIKPIEIDEKQNENNISIDSNIEVESIKEDEIKELVKITEEEKKEEGAENCYKEIKRKKTHSSITFFSLVVLSKEEKKFLKKLYPKELPSKSTLSPDYSNLLSLSSDFVNKKIQKKLAPPKKERVIIFKPKMFMVNKKPIINESMYFEEEILLLLRNFFYIQYQQNKLNISLCNHLMNTYVEMSPEVISDFILGIEKNPKKKSIKNIKSFKRQNAIMDLKGNKSCYSYQQLSLFERILSKRENLLYYQKNIFQDHELQQNAQKKFKKTTTKRGTLINGEYILDSSSSNDSKKMLTYSNDDKDEFYSSFEVKRKKRRANLHLLQNERIYKNENHNKSSDFQNDLYLKYTKGKVDETLNTLLREIHSLQNKDIINSKFKTLVFHLLKHCVIHFEEDMFFQFFTKYKEVIDVNLVDEDGNSLLLLATKMNSLRLINFLLYNGADVDITNKFGNTAMHYAVAGKYYASADLLRKFNAREDLQNIYGKIPWECLGGTCEEGDNI